MPGRPNGTDMEIIFHMLSCKPSLARTWKLTSEIRMIRAYSNHHQLFLEAETKWGMQPEQKMQISQSLSSRSTENTRRKAMSSLDPLYQNPNFPAKRKNTILDFKKRKKERKRLIFYSKISWCIWSNLQKFHWHEFCQHTCPWCKER